MLTPIAQINSAEHHSLLPPSSATVESRSFCCPDIPNALNNWIPAHLPRVYHLVSWKSLSLGTGSVKSIWWWPRRVVHDIYLFLFFLFQFFLCFRGQFRAFLIISPFSCFLFLYFARRDLGLDNVHYSGFILHGRCLGFV